MIHFFSNHKIIFKLTNLVLLIIYLYPGSLAGFFIYNDFAKQPQLTPDFFNISSNHFYVFIIVSVLGVLTYFQLKKLYYLFGFLILYSNLLMHHNAFHLTPRILGLVCHHSKFFL